MRIEKDIQDYASLDGQPARIVFMIAAGSKQHSEYLRVLAHLTEFLKNDLIRESLLNATKPSEFYDVLIRGVQ